MVVNAYKLKNHLAHNHSNRGDTNSSRISGLSRNDDSMRNKYNSNIYKTQS